MSQNHLIFETTTNYLSIPGVLLIDDWSVTFDVTPIPDFDGNETIVLGRLSNGNSQIGFNRVTGNVFVGVNGVRTNIACPVPEGVRVKLRLYVSAGTLFLEKNDVPVGSTAFTTAFTATFDAIGASAGDRYAMNFFSLQMVCTGVNRNYSAAGITSGTIVPELNGGTNANLDLFISTPWGVEPPTPDITPFALTAVINANTNSPIESNSVTIAGATGSKNIVVSGGLEYAINTGSGFGAFTNAPGTVVNGNIVKYRLQSSPTNNVQLIGSTTVGNFTTTFNVRTRFPATGISEISNGWVRRFENAFQSRAIPITAAVNDLIFITVAIRNTATRPFSPTWNGQAFTALVPTTTNPTANIYSFWLKVSTGGTANLTGSLGSWCNFAVSFRVLRSATNSFASPPVSRNISYERSAQAFTNPELSFTGVAPNDFVIATALLNGFTPSWSVASGTRLALEDTVNFNNDHNFNAGATEALGRFYSAVSSGFGGNLTSRWIPTSQSSNMYSVAMYAISEATNNVTNPTNPLVPGGTLTATLEGYSAITAITVAGFNGTDINVAGGTLTATMSGLAEGQILPVKLPATNVAVTYTDGISTSVLQQNISLPLGFDTIRNIDGEPSDLRDIITNHPDFIGTWYFDNGTPLVAGERFYWPTQTMVNGSLVDNGFKISEIGEIEANKDILPITVPCYLQRANGEIQLHNLTVNKIGIINVSLLDWTTQSTSPIFDGNYPKSIRP